MDAIIKREVVETSDFSVQASKPIASIDPNATESDSDSYNYSDFDSSDNRSRVLDGINGCSFKKRKLRDLGVVLPIGFLDPLPPEEPMPLSVSFPQSQSAVVVKSCKQFWKAGDYEGGIFNGSESSSFGGMDHVRVHPKFLHSNATSHKWALGAFAELLDNSLDEICHGATYVNTDMLENKKDGSRMLLVEDNGGGMDPLSMRQCMSLGYSEKSKSANTIGQYGNGFKTSTMRLGADVIVFSRCCGKDGKSPMQSIGMLSYTFLRGTGKEDIVVPMLDYEKVGQVWHKMLRSSPGDWSRNVETIVQWSPYSSEADLLHQFNLMEDQGTRIVIYNLWEDEHGELELDFDTDRYDIQIKGVNREDAKIQMAQQFPNSRHFLTYRHSLRSYASILYLRLPPGFRIILRGKDVEHHNIVNDMMLTQEITYRPVGPDGVPKDLNMFAIVKIGFVKDAKEHIDVQGFNVYHKNRLIKPFWRVWNSSGSDGRGVIGVLEANFIEPAHDKQGFERTIVLSRLEARLQYMQKQYWSSKCQEIGYAPRRHKKLLNEPALLESSPECLPQSSSRHSKKSTSPIKVTSLLDTVKCQSHSNQKQVGKKPEKSSKVDQNGNGHMYGKEENRIKTTSQFGQRENSQESTSQCAEDVADYKMADVTCNGNGHATFDSNAYGISLLKKENNDLKEMCKSLEVKLQEAEQKLKEMDKEQETLIDILSEERSRRDNEEENLRKKLKGASNTIEVLVNKVRWLENTRSHSCKPER